MSLAKIAGLGLAATGALHFVAPQAFEEITKGQFPDDTEAWIKRNGASELAVGLLVANEKTRKLGLLGLLAYVGFIASRMMSA